MTPRPSPKNNLNSQDYLRVGGTLTYCGLASATVVVIGYVCGEFGRVLPAEVQAALSVILTAAIQTGVYYFSGKRR